ncbi:MAG: hypothetical protein JW940_07810 [Polyangiaceae bacterium]|nr:hypothetical protein [Polyangiaceae bacterium]
MSRARFSCSRRKRPRVGPLVLGALAVSVALASPAQAASVIKRPGLHPNYDVEIEPHLLVQWAQSPWGQDGFGPGVRFDIPLFDNGPIDTINNNMAIGFGMDWAIFDDVCGWYWRYWYRDNVPAGYAAYDCTAHALSFPVVLQWNFFLTDKISVFGEPGLTIQHFWWDSDYCDDYTDYRCNDSDTDLDIAFWGGGRFLVGDTVSIIARLGTPYVSVGVGFLL